MSGMYHAGQVVSARWSPPDSLETQAITVTVISEPTPGMYVCQTNMGVTMLLAEDDLIDG